MMPLVFTFGNKTVNMMIDEHSHDNPDKVKYLGYMPPKFPHNTTKGKMLKSKIIISSEILLYIIKQNLK